MNSLEVSALLRKLRVVKALHFESMFLVVRLGSTPVSVFPTGGLVVLTALMGVGIFGVATIEWRTLRGGYEMNGTDCRNIAARTGQMSGLMLFASSSRARLKA